jgi:hypothetical protein
VNLRVFEVEGGVSVSAPFVTVGSVVKVTDAPDGAMLEVKGRIISERIRARRGA